MLKQIICIAGLMLIFAACEKDDTTAIDNIEDVYLKATIGNETINWGAKYDNTSRSQSLDSILSNSSRDNFFLQSSPQVLGSFGINSLMGRYKNSNFFIVTMLDTLIPNLDPPLSYFLPKLKVGSYPMGFLTFLPSLTVRPGFFVGYQKDGITYSSIANPRNNGFFRVTRLEKINDTLFHYIMECEFDAVMFRSGTLNDSLRVQGKFRNVMMPR
ncbi:MAG: hypothetical protein WBP58_10810 [Chitinophagaceae bacterium]